MFLISQNEYYSIEHTKSELIKLLSQMRQEIAASRQSQTSMACSHIEYSIYAMPEALSLSASRSNHLTLRSPPCLDSTSWSYHQKRAKAGTKSKH